LLSNVGAAAAPARAPGARIRCAEELARASRIAVMMQRIGYGRSSNGKVLYRMS